jgi:hypothetical protein
MEHPAAPSVDSEESFIMMSNIPEEEKYDEPISSIVKKQRKMKRVQNKMFI